MNFIHPILGYISGLVILLACIVYINAVIKGNISSNKVGWGIWALVQAVSLITYYKTNGLVSSIWVYVAYLAGTLLIFVLLTLYTNKGQWTWFETVVVIGVIITLLAWFFSKSSLLAMTFILIIDILGAVLIVKNTYFDPLSEYGVGWYLGFAGNFINLWAVEKWDYANSAYPIYLATMTFIVSLLIFFPKFLKKNKI